MFGFLLGMFALEWATNLAKRFDAPVPRIPGLTIVQTFGLGGVVISLAGCLALFWR